MLEPANISRISLFSGCGEGLLREIAPHVERLEIPEGTIIFREGEEAKRIYCLDEGSIDISIEEAGPGAGTVGIVRSGECFGWSALVPPYFFTSMARALEDSVVFSVDGPGLKMRMHLHPDLAWSVFEGVSSTIAKRLDGARHRILTAAVGRSKVFSGSAPSRGLKGEIQS